MTLNKLATLAATSIIFGNLAIAQAQESSDRGWWSGWGMGHMMDQGHGPMMGKGYGPGPGYGHMMGRGYGPMMGYDFSQSTDRIDGRLAFIKAELKITAEQEEAWSKFADTVRDQRESHLESMEEMMEAMHGDDYHEQSLPDRLALHETHMAERLEQLRTIRTSVEALYTQLSDEQKETADQIVMPMMGMGHGMGMHMGRGWMRH